MGPLDGVTVVEVSHEAVAWAGKLMADLGARVVVVEPPAGSVQRHYGPFAGDVADPARSLWWWHYNTSKLGVVLDLDDEAGQAGLRRLLAEADVLLEAEVPGRLAALGLDAAALEAANPALVHCAVTWRGQASGASAHAETDLTVLAAGGPVWSCGYDDHTLPPVRGGGNQGYHTASHWAVMSVLVALLEREETGRGQFIDVSAVAAANVTTEMASYGWLGAEWEVQRQTGRHATPTPTQETQVRCADGRYVNTGVPARTPVEFREVLAWLDELGLREEFPLTALLEMGAERERISLADVEDDPMIGEIFGAGREAQWFLAERLGAYEYFTQSQGHGLVAGIVYAPEEVLADPHFIARGFPVGVDHDGTTYTYPGAPYRFGATPWSVRRAPSLGEHQHEVFGPPA